MLKKIMGSIREYKKETLLSPLFIALEVALECLLPYVMSRMIDNIYGDAISVIVKYGLILVVMAFASLACGALAGKFCATASAGFAKNLRHDLYHKVQDFSFTNIDKFSSASLVTRLTTDVTNVQNAFMMLIRGALRSPIMLVFSLVMAFTINKKLALVFLALIPFLGAGLFLIISKSFKLFDKLFSKYDDLNNSVQENIKGMRVVKAYVRENYEEKKFNERSDMLRDGFIKAETIVALNGPLMAFVMNLSMMLISVIGTTMIIEGSSFDQTINTFVWGELSTGQLSSLITYSFQILSSLMMVSMIMVMIIMSAASMKRIVEVLDEDSSIVNPTNPVMAVSDGSIDFENVSFKYSSESNRMALHDINLHIDSGMTVGIIGGTGSSKTSMVNLLSRLYDVTEGSVKVGGIDVRKYDLDTIRNAVSVVLQKNVLFSGTIKENLRWGNAEANDEEIEHACKLAQADEFIQAMPDKYDTYIEQSGANVSGGQKQRLCIARALLKNPKVLILDDSTSAVDMKTDALIRKAFTTEIPNVTKLIVAQRIASVCEADMIIVMDNGSISATGTHEELLKSSEIYQEVYYSQNKVGDDNE